MGVAAAGSGDGHTDRQLRRQGGAGQDAAVGKGHGMGQPGGGSRGVRGQWSWRLGRRHVGAGSGAPYDKRRSHFKTVLTAHYILIKTAAQAELFCSKDPNLSL